MQARSISERKDYCGREKSGEIRSSNPHSSTNCLSDKEQFIKISLSLGYKMSEFRTNKMEEKIEWNFKSSTVSLWYLHHVQCFHSFCVFISAIKLLWPLLGRSNKSLNWYSQSASHQPYPKCSKCPRHSLVPALCTYESRWSIGSKSNMDLFSILKWLSTKVSTLY